MNMKFTVGVVGNPNCGKTTLFNALTGSKQMVGNWPGVTVEKKTGEYHFQGAEIEVVDLPGTYSLESDDDNISLDEKIARDYVAEREADLIINIVDASNLERNLYLTSQLIEMRSPMIVALNMMDMVRKNGIQINHKKLAEKLGCPVVPISAATGEGLDELKHVINQSCMTKPVSEVKIPYPEAIERAVEQLIPVLTKTVDTDKYDLRWLALRLLENDTLAWRIAGSSLSEKVRLLQQQIEDETGEEIDILAADARYTFVNQLTRDCVEWLKQVSRDMTDKIDHVVLNRFLGIPIFLVVMYLMFMFTINIGSAFIDFFDQLAGAFFVEGFRVILEKWSLPEWLIVLLADGAGGGVQVVATFIPIIGFLFVFLSFLEDTGYMARAAFVMDRFMRFIGLPGKSFVPMIVGFGCNVPAIMATRTLENPRDRILTNLMNPFMSCGARLPVYALFAAAFFPVGGQNLVFGLYLIGIAVAVMTGLIMRHTLFKGEVTPFVMELPTYHLPTWQGIYLKTWDRLKSFIVKAGAVIVPMVLVLNFLNAWGIDGSFDKQNSSKSVLSEIGRSLTPAFEPMGIKPDNWPATVGIFTGVMAKEAVVGTLSALYTQLASQQMPNNEDEQPFELTTALNNAFQTIPENLAGVADQLLDPLGLKIESDAEASAETTEKLAYQAMREKFDGKTGAFAYLLFVLLYAPCVAATAAIYRETSAGWTVFVVCWTTGIAYITATVFYQAMTWERHPEESLFWIVVCIAAFFAVVAALWLKGKLMQEGNHDPVRN
jgi:ferrous iron transport protein B